MTKCEGVFWYKNWWVWQKFCWYKVGLGKEAHFMSASILKHHFSEPLQRFFYPKRSKAEAAQRNCIQMHHITTTTTSQDEMFQVRKLGLCCGNISHLKNGSFSICSYKVPIVNALLDFLWSLLCYHFFEDLWTSASYRANFFPQIIVKKDNKRSIPHRQKS